MFKFLLPNVNHKNHKTAAHVHYLSTIATITLTGSLLLTACNSQTDSNAPPESTQIKTQEQQRAEDSQPVAQSESAAARIEQFQPLYIAQALGLQRRLQAEYESLQAADISGSESGLLSNNVNQDNNEAADTVAVPEDTSSGTTTVNDPTAVDSSDLQSVDSDINMSTEVGERDLTVLKRISLESRKPDMLTEAQIIENYQQAMQALYQSVTTKLSAQETDTLLNIAALIPQLFEHPEIANRVNAKSPALARLIIQRQVWEQIEAQQVIDMQQMKLVQQQEFETLMNKFNDTIKDYDEQIAKYEQTLKEFQ